MVVKAVEHLEDDLDKSLIGIKKVTGGSITDSLLVEGVAFRKTFSYAGFEQQPKKFDHPKIVLLNHELELKSERENAEVRLDNPDDFQKVVDAEWKLIYDKLDKIIASGAQIILSRLPIGDLATQYFADRGLFCAGRVPHDDLLRLAKATGGVVQTTVNGIT
jgi:T-complex protein 1 subunit eta